MNVKANKAKKQSLSAGKPDLETMENFLSLLTFGCRDEEVICIGQWFKEETGRYLNYADFMAELPSHVRWLAESQHPILVAGLNPLLDTYPQTRVGESVSQTHKAKHISRLRWIVLDIDRIEEIKKAGPANGEQLSILKAGMEEMVKALKDLGFTSLLTTFSGNGHHIFIPIELENLETNHKKLMDFKELVEPYLAEYPQLEIDPLPLKPRTVIRIPGSVNRKYDNPVLTKIVNSDEVSREEIDNSRPGNTQLLETLLAENLLSKKTTKGYESPMVMRVMEDDFPQLLTAYDKLQTVETIVGWLESLGYVVTGRGEGSLVRLRRPGRPKDRKGPTVVVGGQGNLTYSWSTGDSLLPAGIPLRPYWLKLLLEGIVKQNHCSDKATVVQDEKYKAFFTNIRNTFGTNSTQTNSKPVTGSQGPAPLPIVEIKNEPAPEDEKGTLSDIRLPGILEEIAEDIGRNNAILAPEIDRAYAITLFNLLVGKSRVGPTRLPCSTYLVVLAPSSCGKDSGKAYLPRFMRKVDELCRPKEASLLNLKTYSIRGVVGTSFGSPEGLQDELLIHGRLCINGNESERFLHPSSRDKACLDARDFLLDASGGKELSGRALAGGRKRPGIPNPFVTMIHTSQPTSYFAAFQEDSEFKGHLGRFVHLTAGWGKVNYNHIPGEIPEHLLKEGIYWHQENLIGLEQKLERLKVRVGDEDKVCLGRFDSQPKVIQYTPSFNKRQLDYFQHCRDEARKANQSGNKALENIWSRVNEQSLRLSYIFTLAENRNALEVDPKQFDLATKIMERSLQVVACSGEDRLRVKSSKDRERVLNTIKAMVRDKNPKDCLEEGWVRKNRLLKKCDKWLEDGNQLNRILLTLQEQGFLEWMEGLQGQYAGKVRLIQAQ